LGPPASGAIYCAWLAIDSAGCLSCGRLSLTYGFIPFFLAPILFVAVRARNEGRSPVVVAALVAVVAIVTAATLIVVWLFWFGQNSCG
jgi:uncharacterized membrane protein YhhN